MHEILSALGEINRIRIIECLATGPKTVGVLAQMTTIPMVNASHHLGLLSHAKVVCSERKGRYISYCLNSDICSFNDDGDVLIKHPKGHVVLKMKD